MSDIRTLVAGVGDTGCRIVSNTAKKLKNDSRLDRDVFFIALSQRHFGEYVKGVEYFEIGSYEMNDKETSDESKHCFEEWASSPKARQRINRLVLNVIKGEAERPRVKIFVVASLSETAVCGWHALVTEMLKKHFRDSQVSYSVEWCFVTPLPDKDCNTEDYRQFCRAVTEIDCARSGSKDSAGLSENIDIKNICCTYVLPPSLNSGACEDYYANLIFTRLFKLYYHEQLYLGEYDPWREFGRTVGRNFYCYPGVTVARYPTEEIVEYCTLNLLNRNLDLWNCINAVAENEAEEKRGIHLNRDGYTKLYIRIFKEKLRKEEHTGWMKVLCDRLAEETSDGNKAESYINSIEKEIREHLTHTGEMCKLSGVINDIKQLKSQLDEKLKSRGFDYIREACDRSECIKQIADRSADTADEIAESMLRVILNDEYIYGADIQLSHLFTVQNDGNTPKLIHPLSALYLAFVLQNALEDGAVSDDSSCIPAPELPNKPMLFNRRRRLEEFCDSYVEYLECQYTALIERSTAIIKSKLFDAMRQKVNSISEYLCCAMKSIKDEKNRISQRLTDNVEGCSERQTVIRINASEECKEAKLRSLSIDIEPALSEYGVVAAALGNAADIKPDESIKAAVGKMYEDIRKNLIAAHYSELYIDIADAFIEEDRVISSYRHPEREASDKATSVRSQLQRLQVLWHLAGVQCREQTASKQSCTIQEEALVCNTEVSSKLCGDEYGRIESEGYAECPRDEIYFYQALYGAVDQRFTDESFLKKGYAMKHHTIFIGMGGTGGKMTEKLKEIVDENFKKYLIVDTEDNTKGDGECSE